MSTVIISNFLFQISNTINALSIGVAHIQSATQIFSKAARAFAAGESPAQAIKLVEVNAPKSLSRLKRDK
jgi:hypothetical protein